MADDVNICFYLKWNTTDGCMPSCSFLYRPKIGLHFLKEKKEDKT